MLSLIKRNEGDTFGGSSDGCKRLTAIGLSAPHQKATCDGRNKPVLKWKCRLAKREYLFSDLQHVDELENETQGPDLNLNLNSTDRFYVFSVSNLVFQCCQAGLTNDVSKPERVT